MGGLGHMGVKIAHAMGAEVTVLSQSLSKQDDGERFGADHYYATSDDETFKKLAGTLRPDHQHGVGAPADGEVPVAARSSTARWSASARRRSRSRCRRSR